MIRFIINSVLLGVGLAMDAFSVSMANGLNEPRMRKRKFFAIAGTFAFFQALMPMTGWLCVHTIIRLFTAFELVVPWIALALLGLIGGKMIRDGLAEHPQEKPVSRLGPASLLLQGIATSIDALSVGFAIADDQWESALAASLIIASVTFLICVLGLQIGRGVGTKLSGRAGILGGVILILIGIEIFVSGVIF